MFKCTIILLSSLAFFACSNDKSASESVKDSVEKKEMKQVDEMVKNQDSLLKAKEKELKEMYR
ncbi:MAG TPA: hypothetical protein VGF79_12545 [Bacteroidia bacterium]